jgi:hypothetical protein
MPDNSVYRGAEAVHAHFADLEDAIGRMHVEVVDWFRAVKARQMIRS